MYAVIAVGGKQYRVREGEYLLVDRLAHDEGAKFEPRVVMASDGKKTLATADELGKVTVTARVDEHTLGEKIRIFTYKPKTHGSARRKGHRSKLSKITIEKIKL